MNSKNGLWSLLGWCCFLFTIAPPSRQVLAAPITFADYSQSTVSDPFVFTNTGAGSTFVTTSKPITFQFDVANTYGAAFQSIPAHLTMTAIVNAPAVPLGGFAIQPLKAIDWTFTADVPVKGQTLLLKVVADFGTLSGHIGGNGALESSNWSSGDNIIFSSSFLGFSGTIGNASFATALTLTPSFTINGNGFLNSFSASGSTGSFATGLTMVPEPSSLILLAFAGTAAGCGILRRRRKTA